MRFTLRREERLKSKKLIAKLYEDGKSFKVFPLRIIYLQTEHISNYPVQIGFSVPKRNFKRAVDRNKIKRLLRESYRKEKYTIYSQSNKKFIFMISYLAKEDKGYAEIEIKMKKLLTNFITEINKNEK